MSGKFPGNFHEISRKFVGNFQDISGKHLGNVQEISGNFLGYFRETSRTFPGKFRELSEKTRGHFLDKSGKVRLSYFFLSFPRISYLNGGPGAVLGRKFRVESEFQDQEPPRTEEIENINEKMFKKTVKIFIFLVF